MAHAFAYIHSHRWLAAAVALIFLFGDDRGCFGRSGY